MRYLGLLAVCSVLLSMNVRADDSNTASGTVNMGDKYNLEIKHVYLLSAAEGEDKGRRLIFSPIDIAAVIDGCATISCVMDELDEGMELQLDTGKNMTLRGVANEGRFGDFSTLDRSWLKTTSDTPNAVDGVLAHDHSHLGGGMVTNIEFKARLTKAFSR
ncbi:MAG TPA: hypothetical protein VMS12_07265 [Thermoanaerobaculia bacterium]|nr:hypothetical protein [Thermoanaerobaculia bacterium]